MKALNLITKSALCLIMIHLSLGCTEDSSKRSGVGIYRAPVKNVSEPGAESVVGNITGAVVASFNGSESQEDYQIKVNAFATAFMLPEDDEFGLGLVNANYDEITDTSGTGVRLNLNICLSNGGEIDSSQSYNNVLVSGTGQPLTIYIKDSKVNDNSEDYSPIEISGYTVNGTINGKTINLVFENNLGLIRMSGEYNTSSTWFAGNISFDNKVNFQSGKGTWESSLGQFYVQMSSLSRNCAE